jgi:DNA-binding response OmpR family regulator
MGMRKIILVVENDIELLDLCVEALQMRRYDVQIAINSVVSKYR